MNQIDEKAGTTRLGATFRPSFADGWCQTVRPSMTDSWCQTVFELTGNYIEWNWNSSLVNSSFCERSRRFDLGNDCSFTLCRESNNEYLEIFLEFDRNVWYTTIAPPILVITRIAIKKGDFLSTEKFFIKRNNFGFNIRSKLGRFNKEELQKSKFYEKEGKVTIYCTIKFWTPKETESGTFSSKIAPDVCHSGLVSTQLKELFTNNTVSDVNLNVGGRIFHAHKIILAAKSKVFAAMFEHKTVESFSNKVDIQDVDPDVFHEVLRFLYTGRLSFGRLDKMAVDVLAVADKYMLDQLKAECETHLTNSMSADNCVKLLAFAVQPHPAMHLKKFAVDFLRRFPFLVMATDGWKKAKEEKVVWSCELIEMLFGV